MKDKILKGALVDIISIATACTKSEVKKMKEFLSKNSLTPNFFFEKDLTLNKPQSHEFPSFSAFDRFQQFKKALENPDSKIIWNARGGYGSAEILPFLEKLPKPKKRKIFIGFSDISSLNNLLINRWKWRVITAPMLAQIALESVSKNSEKAILDLIFGKKTELKYRVKSLNFCEEKNICAEVIGGCVSVLAGQFGTKNQLNWKGKILFLEDEGEDGERLDRYFQQIVRIILEKKSAPKAVLLGNFLEANPHGNPKRKNIEIAIGKFAENLKKISIPLFAEKLCVLGHSKNILPIILGAKATIQNQQNLIQNLTNL